MISAIVLYSITEIKHDIRDSSVFNNRIKHDIWDSSVFNNRNNT